MNWATEENTRQTFINKGMKRVAEQCDTIQYNTRCLRLWDKSIFTVMDDI